MLSRGDANFSAQPAAAAAAPFSSVKDNHAGGVSNDSEIRRHGGGFGGGVIEKEQGEAGEKQEWERHAESSLKFSYSEDELELSKSCEVKK